MGKPAVIMPRMRPVPIKTKDLPWWKALWVWVKTTRKWEVEEDWYFFIEYLGIWVMIPKGFIFDGASIPKIFRPFFSPVGILLIPGLLHDFGYRFGYLFDGQPGLSKLKVKVRVLSHFDRTSWDLLFKKTAIQVNGFKRMMNLPYWAVLVGGGFTWRKYRKGGK